MKKLILCGLIAALSSTAGANISSKKHYDLVYMYLVAADCGENIKSKMHEDLQPFLYRELMSSTADNPNFKLDAAMSLIMKEQQRLKDTDNFKAFKANCDYVLKKAALL